jgi:penicillin-binding protein 1C
VIGDEGGVEGQQTQLAGAQAADGPRAPSLWSRVLIYSGALTVGLVLLLWVLTSPPPLPSVKDVKSAWRPSEAWLYDRNGALIDSARVNFRTRRLDWVVLQKIAPTLRRATVDAEDKRFFEHGGIDWLAIGSAIRTRFDGSRSRGASTLTMQVAGFLAPSLAPPGARSWRDKLRQMRAAWALESNWSKDEILEAYLNMAGFRGEAQGAAAAALSLFGKTPDALSPADAALMVALLPAPGAPPAEIAARACRLAPKLDCGGLRVAAIEMASERQSTALDPGLASHLAAKLLKEPGVKITTTLDTQMQVAATVALKRQLLSLGRDRARDGAVIAVDNATGDVIAYVGGVGGDSTAAFVDGADAMRQAGSTLKPFLYAQVIEGGYLTPASILDDSPVQLDTASGLYVPQNYDRSFKGPVSVRTALAGSLNVPAVRTLMLAGTESFRDRLWDVGYRGLTEDGDYYGFSLALGSAEVTLMQQAAAYRALAMGGVWSRLRLLKGDASVAPRRVFSAQSAWMISDILADPSARASSFGLDSALKLPFWSAAKTGTSKAMRDNWCVGFSDRFTVAVWVGNLEGDSMKAVSGTSGAAPVWRDVMLALHRDKPGKAPAMPAGIERRQIQFAGNIEPSRFDYFLTGTGQSVAALSPREARRPRITNPLSGTVFATDPDIPPARQQMAISATGAVTGHRILFDRRDIGSAESSINIPPIPGAHRIALIDPGGRVVDQVLFSVR